VKPRVVVLGTGSVGVDESVPRERPGHSLDSLLDARPDAAIIADEGESAFFRASLAFERRVARVVVRAGALPRPWLDELAARATDLGSELFVRGEDERYQRVASKARVRLEVSAPPAESFSRTGGLPTSGEPMRLLELSAAERGVRCEEVAFAIGLKPVLYLVVRRRDLAEVHARYAGLEVATESDRLALSVGSGERTYGAGDEVAHLFIGRQSGEAARAAALWAGDSSRNVEALGEAMGYPSCCVRAFAAMASRRVNAAFPYVTAARTLAFGHRFDPWLDVTSARLVPFVPCSYACPRAIDWAQRVAEAASIPARKGRLVLFLDEARAIAFEHAVRVGYRVEYREPLWASPELDEPLRRGFGALFGTQGVFEVTADAIEVESDGGRSRFDSGGLGVVLPFEGSATLSAN